MKDALRIYRPLIIIFAVSVAAAASLWLGGNIAFMQGLMAFFLLLIAVQKLFDIDGFARNFRKYDPLARRIPAYARVYPVVEAILALLYFSGLFVYGTNLTLIAVLSITTIGVMRTISRGESLTCGCAGSAFSLPVGRVTVFENLVMIVMAIIDMMMFNPATV